MPPANLRRRKTLKFLDIKVLISTLSVAVIIGLWNLFANNGFAIAKAAPKVIGAPSPEPLPGSSGDLPPLPTITPLLVISSLPADSAAVSSNSPAIGQAPAALREVTAPTQVIVQKFKPIVAQQVGSGSITGGSASPVTVTRSSRP